jgi:hypothetical protein
VEGTQGNPFGCEAEVLQSAALDILYIQNISPQGPVSVWNANNQAASVHVGDGIVKVTDEQGVDPVKQMLRDGSVELKVVRPPSQLFVSIDKCAKQLGLRCKKSESSAGHLLVVEVLGQGAMAEHNARQLTMGCWFAVVLPWMRIDMVNGIEGDSDRMLQAIGASETVEFRIQRQGLVAPEASLPPGKEVPEVLELPHGARVEKSHTWDVRLVADGSKSIGVNVRDSKEYDLMLVAEVLDTGRLAAWNVQHPAAAVQSGDFILDVNGERSLAGMQQQLAESVVLLRMLRPPSVFEVSLQKPEGQRFGLSTRQAGPEHLVVADVLSEGAMADWNAKQAREAKLGTGGACSLVLPNMQICAVNGIQRQPDKMFQALRDSSAVRIQFQCTHEVKPSV